VVPDTYVIAVRGRLGAPTLDALDARGSRVDGGLTLVNVVISDQDELHRVLGRTGALGLTLESVRKVASGSDLSGARSVRNP
jgi:hypothetical protein